MKAVERKLFIQALAFNQRIRKKREEMESFLITGTGSHGLTLWSSGSLNFKAFIPTNPFCNSFANLLRLSRPGRPNES
jgi:hypothetical protein